MEPQPSSPSKLGDGTQNHEPESEEKQPIMDGERVVSDQQKQPSPNVRTPEPAGDHTPDPPGTPGALPSFDWEDFEARYEQALRDADEQEQEILKRADALSKYFRVWASAASTHDDERAVKRLQTRRRFVNLSEEKMAQKQQHYDEVVRAFESALALLRSK